MRFQGSLRDCQPCPLRQRCLRTPETTKTRQVAFFYDEAPNASESATARMKRKVDTQWKLYCIVHKIEKLMNYGNMKWQQ
jgi:hypothetical protein